MSWKFHLRRGAFALAMLAVLSKPLMAADINANPSNIAAHLHGLQPGDVLHLAPGKYRPLYLADLNGTPEAWITVRGPESGAPAMIMGAPNSNTVEIVNSSYLAIENLRIDSRGISGAFGISLKGKQNTTHDIRIEGNTLVGQNAGQQTDGISTKSATWGWIIRNNRILGAGTGIYLGDSDGTAPFVHGLVEDNLIQDTIGYNMEIKDQISIPAIAGMPLNATSTIIRNNVFIKDDQPSPDGNRPNLLVGAFPADGAGAQNLYEIYGNLFLHNGNEALFQGSGRLSLHDNIFVDAPADYAAVVLRRQNFPLKLAHVYNNTIYTTGQGILFGTAALESDAVVGNLIFAMTPIAGPVVHSSANLEMSFPKADDYVKSPSLVLGPIDFYPRPGKCQGKPVNLAQFQHETDFNRDFNGHLKGEAAGTATFRGAYAGEGANPGWRLQAGIKPVNLRPGAIAEVLEPMSSPAHRQGQLDQLNSTTSAGKDKQAAAPVDGKQGRGRDGSCGRDCDAHAAGLLLWRSTTGAELGEAK
jgi:hypothetical protein